MYRRIFVQSMPKKLAILFDFGMISVFAGSQSVTMAREPRQVATPELLSLGQCDRELMQDSGSSSY